MCGLSGFIDQTRNRSREAFMEELQRLTAAVQHRGPDDSGHWLEVSVGIGLGFRRLSIVDLSPAGHQPMESSTGRYVIIFNGEVYNFERLRRELARDGGDRHYRGHSDTEVILACIETWGLHSALQRFVGMFSFALWDGETSTLSLVRDRVGVKPLYYGWSDDLFLFGSELKALRAHSRFHAELDREAIEFMLRHSYIPAPHTVYRNVWKVSPGTVLEVPVGNFRSPRVVPYWSAKTAAEAAQGLCERNERAAIDQLNDLLRDSIALRMIADVPLGVFLSGGVDSSVVTAIMQSQSSKPIKSFTIGFHESGYDEARHARAVARHIGTDHTEAYVTPDEAMSVIPDMGRIYDEPFGDSSQIPMYLVSALARRQVTVALSGDGGDELFGGYNRYRWTPSVWNVARHLPASIRSGMAAALRAAASAGALMPRRRETVSRSSAQRSLGDRLRKVSDVLTAQSEREVYRRLVSQMRDDTEMVIGAGVARLTVDDERCDADVGGLAERLMFLDFMTYLPDDILTKVDRASMAVSLEAREPLLDHRIVEFAWRLPLSMKIRSRTTKWILRQLLYRYVPAALIERPKMGFNIPLDAWLRTGLRPWAESLLDGRRLQHEGVLDAQRIRALWQNHLSGRENLQQVLWNVLMFEAWLEEQRPARVLSDRKFASVVNRA